MAGRAAFGAIVVLLLALRASTLVDAGPARNWDTLGYLACALALDGVDGRAIHARVYRATKRASGSRVFVDLTDPKRPYRRVNHRDAHVFAQQRRFYCGRVLYTAAVWIAWKSKVRLSYATLAASLAGWLLCAGLLFAWLGQILPPWLAAFASLALVNTRPMIDVATAASPDSLLAAVMVGACFALCHRPSPTLGVGLLASMCLLRVDAVLFGLCVATGQGGAEITGGIEHGRWRRALPWGLFGTALILAAMTLNTSFGRPWWVVFQFTTLGMTPHIDQISTAFDPWTYAEVVGTIDHRRSRKQPGRLGRPRRRRRLGVVPARLRRGDLSTRRAPVPELDLVPPDPSGG